MERGIGDIVMQALANYWWLILIPLALVAYRWVFRLFGVVIIPQDSVGVINKKFVLFGSHRSLPDGCIIALRGEAGVQADTLAPGIHFGYWPWQYEIDVEKFTTIPEDQIGIVESRDGKPLAAGRVLAKRVDCDSFQDARKFLTGGGERGPQITIIPPGTYRINRRVFEIDFKDVLEIEDNMVGVVTTREGKALATGDIAGRVPAPLRRPSAPCAPSDAAEFRRGRPARAASAGPAVMVVAEVS